MTVGNGAGGCGEGAVVKFVITKDAAGEFRFQLVASNGQTVATSEGYKAKASALSTIESIKAKAADAAIDDQTA